MNQINLKLQGPNFNLIEAKTAVFTFVKKLEVFKQNTERREYNQFVNMQSTALTQHLSDIDHQVYCSHLDSLRKDFESRFEDLVELVIPEWLQSPFRCAAEKQEINVQENLIEIQNNEEFKIIFQKKRLSSFCIEVSEKYPLLWIKVKLLMLAFPLSYLVETEFSSVNHVLTKNRNKLDVAQSGDLRLLLSNFKPDIFKLAKIHQLQGSH